MGGTLKYYKDGDWEPVGEPDNMSPSAIINLLYPVGSVYINANVDTNPAILFGVGTWVAWGVGKAIVGIDTTQTEFDTAEETGGAKTVTLTNGQMPVHSLTLSHHGDEGGSLIRTFGGTGGTTTGGWNGNYKAPPASTGGAGSYAAPTVTWGNNEAHNNLQPYQVGYVWKRTA